MKRRGDGQQVAVALGGLAAQAGELGLGVEDARLRGRRTVVERRAEQFVEFRAGIGRGRASGAAGVGDAASGGRADVGDRGGSHGGRADAPAMPSVGGTAATAGFLRTHSSAS